ncbi:hypothetical protein GWI33_002458 [Rhynchophorus ferrugineus]|uniref:Transcription factor Dp-1 n=1 Tax=Rhynchophorus ferrugineus TaxID=354439 RepID=A0A834IVW0_RHYFE|nr:hypothetical protein GWI33_002458 [Rhynchophorus ferrugineus]
MTQNQSTTNWVIQGANGQPQMVKLVQSTGKPISGIMTSTVAGAPVKIYKSSAVAGDSSQTYTTLGQPQQIIRTLTSNPKIVTKQVPIHVNTSMGTIPKGTKTIRLTQAQMQSIKIVPQSQARVMSIQHSPTSQAIPVIQQAPSQQKRPESGDHIDFAPDNKRLRKSEKLSRGLRHFSMKVCEKVKEKVTTTYNEVADDLVREFTAQQSTANSPLADQYDQKNIRRRVYDALNVLMAMNIISKEKKEIRWIGLPTNSLQECQQLEKEVRKKITSIKEKQKQFYELIISQIAFKSLAQRNKETEEKLGSPGPNCCIQLPFIVINTNKKTVINCSISNDKSDYLLEFSDKFEMIDDLEILKQIGMLHGLDNGKCSKEDLERIKTLIPESLWQYVEKIASGSKDAVEELLESPNASTSAMTQISDFVETTLDEDNSRPSSSNDPLSPLAVDYSEDEVDSDMSSDELN